MTDSNDKRLRAIITWNGKNARKKRIRSGRARITEVRKEVKKKLAGSCGWDMAENFLGKFLWFYQELRE